MIILICLVIGLLSGVFAGFFGLGGGIVLIPMLVYLLDMAQKEAQGTSLVALIPPVGFLAAWQYLREGHIVFDKNVPLGLWIALGLFLGAYFGGRLVNYIEPALLKRIFGIIVLVVGLRMIIKP